jgi:DNA adenine methylase
VKNVKPFLRWAGGKTWLLKYIDDFTNIRGFNNYHEPFLGGGAVFFHLQVKSAYLSDLNEDLICTYQTIRDDVEEVIDELSQFQNTEAFYYNVRKKKFEKEAQRAANFIYLNQTSFNGIYRVNLKGEYNVPYGFRTKNFFEPDNLRAVSKALNGVSIRHADFYSVLDRVKPGDLVFLDPPYTVTHNNNGFIKYNQKLFSIDDQIRLSTLIDEIKSIGAYYILTNAAHEKIKEIFDKSDYQIEKKRASLIGGLQAKRGKYSELIFTNVEINETSKNG